MPNGYRPINSSGIIISLVILCVYTGCKCEQSPKTTSLKANYCPQAYGCLNDSFINRFEDKCTDKEKGCRFSFEEFFGEMDKVNFQAY
jgi:hypothetical protein